MITCPACGKENEESAFECRRCRAPLRDEQPPEEDPVAAAPADEESSSKAFGTVCPTCEAYNEPGVDACTSCGQALFAGASSGEGALDETPSHAPADDSAQVDADELDALALSPEEAAEAMGNGTWIPDEPALSTPPPVAPPQPAAAAPVAASEKFCPGCGASNPPAAKFCFDCGAPFAKKAAPPPPVEPAKTEAPRFVEPLRPIAAVEHEPSIQVIEADDLTAETPPVSASDELPAESGAEVFAEVFEEAPPPFAASLVVEKGAAPGTAFALAAMENHVGANGGHVRLEEDPFVAPHAATVLFAEDHLVLRDEGSANGVYVKVREAVPLEPGDCFVAGERLFRFDGAVELEKADTAGDTPLLGSPRPAGPITVRISEVLAGGRTGRTCHRSGPTIAVGRTGCDLNFPADPLLGARHAEIRLGDDGSAQLVDLGQAPSGVWLRLRAQQALALQAGDLLQLGEQQLRIEVG